MSDSRLLRGLCAGALGCALLVGCASSPPPAPLPAVHQAVLDGDIQRLQQVLRTGSNIAVRDHQGRTAVHIAAMQGDAQVIATLLQAGLDVNGRDPVGSGGGGPQYSATPLHLAANRADVEAVRLLLEHGAQVDAANRQGQTPLTQVSGGPRPRVTQRGGGQSAMITIVDQSEAEIVIMKMLLAAGASPNPVSEGGPGPLHRAARGGTLAQIELLLESGAQVNVAGPRGATPLHEAAQTRVHRDADRVRMLLLAGADPNARDAAGQTPLHNAAHTSPVGQNRLRIPDRTRMELLLMAGAKSGVVDSRGWAPLHYVSRYPTGYNERGFQIALMLIDAGADPTARTRDGKSAADLAYEAYSREHDLLKGLIAAGSPFRGTSGGSRGMASIAAGVAMTAYGTSQGLSPQQSAEIGSALARDIYQGGSADNLVGLMQRMSVEQRTQALALNQGLAESRRQPSASGGLTPYQRGVLRSQTYQACAERGGSVTQCREEALQAVEVAIAQRPAAADAQPAMAGGQAPPPRPGAGTRGETAEGPAPQAMAPTRRDYAGVYATEHNDDRFAHHHFILREDGGITLCERACDSCIGTEHGRNWYPMRNAQSWAPLTGSDGGVETSRVNYGGVVFDSEVLGVRLADGQTLRLHVINRDGRRAIHGPYRPRWLQAGSPQTTAAQCAN